MEIRYYLKGCLKSKSNTTKFNKAEVVRVNNGIKLYLMNKNYNGAEMFIDISLKDLDSMNKISISPDGTRHVFTVGEE